MFHNSYQNGASVELYDPKVAPQKMKNLFRMANVQGNNKVFDKELKTFVLEFCSSTARIGFPREDRQQLYLIQQYLVMQLQFMPTQSWSMELVISDLTKSKRRILFSGGSVKAEVKPFFVRAPCRVEEGVWTNFIVDLHSYIQAFKGQTFRSLDAIYLTGHFKLRRIYTLRDEPGEMDKANLLPRTFQFPSGLETITAMHRYDCESTEPSTKNSSFLSKLKPLTPSTPNEFVRTDQHLPKKPTKSFLAHTNATDMLSKARKEDSDSPQLKVQSKSTEKYLKKKKLTQTQQVPSKNRTSLDKIPIKTQEKTKTKAKLNPWRTKNNVDTSVLQKSKRQSQQRNTIQRGSDQYSDSQYVELSQKFSTVTDGKFQKQSPWRPVLEESFNRNEQEQIEEKIEMESNSMHSTMRKEELCEQMVESICDSLEKHQKNQMARSSLYGFGERLTKQFMRERERPYSPPLGQKEDIQQEVERGEKEEVQVIYDPVLNCYYDHKTKTYYELKN